MKGITRKRIVKWFWIIVTVPIAMFILLFLLVWAFADIPSFEELENPDSKLATQVIAEDGEVLTTFHIENRSYVSYEDLSPNLVNAAVATEDVRFYSHSGIDFISLGRVLFKTLLMGDSGQGGGSTITQQLAKTLYPRENVSSRIPGGRQMKMVWIKLKEWITAVKLERNYTKEEIMDMYMNAIFFGSNAYGVQAASKTFFGKNPRDLTVEESAMLVGMVNKPTRYNPVLNPDKALLRRNFVIGQMEKAGYLTKAECDSICRIPITLSYQMLDHNAGIAPYFRDMLRRTMNAREPKRSSYTQYEDYRVDSLQWADNALYGWLEKNRKADGSRYSLDKDGLKIYTTINYRMQKYAEEAVAAGVMETKDDGATLKTTGSIAVQNPLEVVWSMYDDTRMGATMDAYMNGFEDPRLPKYFSVANIDGGGYHGVRSGLVDMEVEGDPTVDLSCPNVSASSEVVWFRASEVAFLRAEGALLNWNMGGDNSAETFYKKGIELSFEENGLSAGEAQTYAASDGVPAQFTDVFGNRGGNYAAPSDVGIAWASDGNELERIITQKWIAMFPNGQEAWSEFRRTGFPKVIPIPDGNNKSNGTIDTDIQVRRMTFPRSEYSNNKAAVDAAAALIGADNGGVRLWWDVENKQ